MAGLRFYNKCLSPWKRTRGREKRGRDSILENLRISSTPHLFFQNVRFCFVVCVFTWGENVIPASKCYYSNTSYNKGQQMFCTYCVSSSTLITIPVSLIKAWFLAQSKHRSWRGGLGTDNVLFVCLFLLWTIVGFFFLTLKLEDSEESS